jgi:hypothetical protein
MDGRSPNSFDQLDRPFHRDFWTNRNQDVEMVGHDHKGMEAELALRAVLVKRPDEEAGGAVRL